MQQCPFCDSASLTRYWLRDVGLYMRCDECLRDLFDDGCLVSTRFDLHLRLKTLEDKLKYKDAELSMMQVRFDLLHCQMKLLETKLEEVYFAPNMPGYVNSQLRFYDIAKPS
jgi:hypothetical protein